MTSQTTPPTDARVRVMPKMVRRFVPALLVALAAMGVVTLTQASPASAQTSTPSSCSVSVQNSAAAIRWSAVNNADSYRIRNNGVVLGQQPRGTSTTVTGRTGIQHFSVAAVDNGVRSGWRYCGSVVLNQDPPLRCTVRINGDGIAEVRPSGNDAPFAVYRDGRRIDSFSGNYFIEDPNTDVGRRHHYSVVRLVNNQEQGQRTYCGSIIGPRTAPRCTVGIESGQIVLRVRFNNGNTSRFVHRNNFSNPRVYSELDRRLGGQTWVNGSRNDTSIVRGRTYHASVGLSIAVPPGIAGDENIYEFTSTRLYCGKVVA